MKIDLALILTALAALTGLVWLLDSLLFATEERQIAEARIQHPHDIGGFVAHHGVGVFVPQHRNRGAARNGGVGAGVKLVHVGEAMQVVGGGACGQPDRLAPG